MAGDLDDQTDRFFVLASGRPWPPVETIGRPSDFRTTGALPASGLPVRRPAPAIHTLPQETQR